MHAEHATPHPASVAWSARSSEPSGGEPSRSRGFAAGSGMTSSSSYDAAPDQGIPRRVLLIVGALVVVALVLVGLSLRRPELAEFSPTAVDSAEPSGPGPH